MPVVDLWHQMEKQPDGSKKKVRSAKYGRGKRWAARCRDNNGDQKSPTFKTKAEAENHLKNVEGDLVRGQYVNPAAGKVTFRDYAEQWRRNALHRPSTAERVERALRNHIYPKLGNQRMSMIRPSHIQAWVSGLQGRLAPSTIRAYYGDVAAIFTTAVRDDVIARTPCRGIKLPEVSGKKKPVMPVEQVAAIRAALPEQFRAVIDLAAGSGLRQGEMFGLEVRHVDFLRRVLTVEQQLSERPGERARVVPPKTDASYREIPLTERTTDVLAAHLAQYPAVELEVEDATDPDNVHTRTAAFVFTTQAHRPVRRMEWSRILAPAMKAAGLPKRSGLHAIRRFYASLLIRYGESVKTVQERMGHSSAATTLDTYAGLWPDSEDRTREAVDAGLAELDDVRPMCAAEEG
ncbi:tyrosine-type recombinase/integrase [Allosalinactinospora lopnorensis]|uniref:tyrosine-type recombinase/integrase n=1 Tax=Allosalinactinospora lopnorensis TaxID=1352348 RepID=UPI000623F2D4|nr:site-specific integrase [Allosalinactinospora lopnorensis]